MLAPTSGHIPRSSRFTSKAPRGVEPPGVGIVELLDIEHLVLELQVEAVDECEADAGRVHVTVVALVDSVAEIGRRDLEVIEKDSGAREQLDESDRQRADDARAVRFR